MKQRVDILQNGQWKLSKAKDDKAKSVASDWVLSGDLSDRDALPRMRGDLRNKALHDLGSHTKTRVNPESGKLEYLLHRGIGEQESWDHEKGGVQHLTSWTPHYHVARKFAEHYNATEPRKIRERTASAWIPEEHVHSIPKHYGVYDRKYQEGDTPIDLSSFADEHEVVVAPHALQHADKDTKNSLYEEYVKNFGDKEIKPKKKLTAKDFY